MTVTCDNSLFSMDLQKECSYTAELVHKVLCNNRDNTVTTGITVTCCICSWTHRTPQHNVNTLRFHYTTQKLIPDIQNMCRQKSLMAFL